MCIQKKYAVHLPILFYFWCIYMVYFHVLFYLYLVKVCNSIQEYLAFKRTALFKWRGAQILNGYFRNNADVALGKKDWRVVFLKTFYMCIGAQDFISAHFALFVRFDNIQVSAEASKANMEKGENSNK